MTTIGFLRTGDYFEFEDKIYKVGHLISNTNGYVACSDVDGKVKRFHIDTVVTKALGYNTVIKEE